MKRTNKDPWEDWMGELKFPVPKTELLDRGLAPLIKLMNVPGKILTTGSCLHDRFIVFHVEDEKWFLKEIITRITSGNERRYRFNMGKIYDRHCLGLDGDKDKYRQRDEYGNRYYWVIKGKWSGKWKFIKELTDIFKQVKGLL